MVQRSRCALGYIVGGWRTCHLRGLGGTGKLFHDAPWNCSQASSSPRSAENRRTTPASKNTAPHLREGSANMARADSRTQAQPCSCVAPRHHLPHLGDSDGAARPCEHVSLVIGHPCVTKLTRELALSQCFTQELKWGEKTSPCITAAPSVLDEMKKSLLKVKNKYLMNTAWCSTCVRGRLSVFHLHKPVY